ncbi:integrator complex subunit 10-like [Atheta coriaria]|uniref:integrator complex subunit 10-like n=1 Tax=Dalotia coriaria TaxID=877792 RepID=UPI0031F4418F
MMEVDNDENYVLNKARSALKANSASAKAWMIMAKTLYPNNFGVQFEAYKNEKNAGNVKEAGRCFTDLIEKFQQVPEFWEEINAVTQALRTESELDAQKQFLSEMFKHLSTEVQHKLLLITADHCEDTQEHCKLLLLLLQKFPSSISSHGMGLIETLLSAEKHNVSGNQPVNKYRELLICDLIPLLNKDGCILDLSPKLIFKLLHKAIEYHLFVLWGYICNKKDDSKQKSEDSWSNLYKTFEFVCHQLHWEKFLPSFSTNWCKDTYWAKILNLIQSPTFNMEDTQSHKQVTYAVAIFLLYCLYQYLYCLNIENVPGQNYPAYLLVQGFLDASFPAFSSDPIASMSAKRRKSTDCNNTDAVVVTIESKTLKAIIPNFTMAVKCWDLLHSADQLNREFIKLSGALNLEHWLSTFLVDHLIYKDKHEDVLRRLENDSGYPQLPKLILKAQAFFLQRNYIRSYDNIREALQLLPETTGETCENLIIGGNQRHLHFLPLTRVAIIQFLAKFILHGIRANGFKTDMSVGHCFVLMQMDWPNEENFLPMLIQEICKTRTFYYLPFQTYIIEIDILEELAFLWNSQNGQITYEILPNMLTRRIGTRGADKGIREEIKHAIKGQIEKVHDPIHELIRQFLLQEQTHISVSLL